MNIFKKLFGKKKEKMKEEKQQECWYNNAHEGSLGHSVILPNDNSLEWSVTMSIANR